MAEGRVERKLAAILAADVVGYSRSMEADQVGTVARLKALRKELFEPLTTRFGGRIFKTMGDGILAEFASAYDALLSAVEVQRQLAVRNADLPEHERIDIRIGISLGDVIVEGDDLYGNGVNVAARMEGLARPGGICISGNVYEHVRTDADVGFEDLGQQQVKNIERPIHAWRVLAHAPKGGSSASPAMSLPDKPSIAVLPFTNMSGDPEQDYFADGISEDLITALSHIRWLFVIARNSSFVYRGQAVDVKQVSRSLGVRYLLEGSVRKSGNRIRITAQLVDALSGAHHWAERFDRDVTDIFALQDEIVQHVVGAIEPSLLAAEGLRSQIRAPEDLDAWDMVARAMSRYWRVTDADI
jgi:adenylate cyclase